MKKYNYEYDMLRDIEEMLQNKSLIFNDLDIKELEQLKKETENDIQKILMKSRIEKIKKLKELGKPIQWQNCWGI